MSYMRLPTYIYQTGGKKDETNYDEEMVSFTCYTGPEHQYTLSGLITQRVLDTYVIMRMAELLTTDKANFPAAIERVFEFEGNTGISGVAELMGQPDYWTKNLTEYLSRFKAAQESKEEVNEDH